MLFIFILVSIKIQLPLAVMLGSLGFFFPLGDGSSATRRISNLRRSLRRAAFVAQRRINQPQIKTHSNE